MSECGGWCVTITDDDWTRMFMVANKNAEEAKKLALARAGSGAINTYAEMSEKEISDLCMEPNEIRESTDISPRRGNDA